MCALGLHAMWAIALVGVAGCNQVFGLDLPAGGSENADARDHDARMIDAAGDRDMDGVVDGDDICPDVADPDQFDEDGDGRGDRCDLCPHLDQIDDADSEEDGVPDACDPYPGMSGGRLRFSGFHTGDEMGDWTIGGAGTGSIDWAKSDAVRIVPALDGEVRIVRRDDDNRQTLTRIIADIDVEAPNSGGAFARRAVGVITNVSVAGTSSFLCQVETDLPVTEARLHEYRFEGAGADVAVATIGSTYPLGRTQLDLDVGIDGDVSTYGPRCAIGGVAGDHLIARTRATELAAGDAGVRTVGVPIRVNWVVIIDHQ